jgi:uncharacterized protein YyaL (SSP411 family)
MGKNILVEKQDISTTARILGSSEEEVSKSLAASRAKLFERRAKRPRPHLDDKILTGWNGLMISAFSKTGAAPAVPRFQQPRAANFRGESGFTAGL